MLSQFQKVHTVLLFIKFKNAYFVHMNILQSECWFVRFNARSAKKSF